MLDKTSERFLNIAISKYDGNMEKEIIITSEEMNIDYTEFENLNYYLRSNKYIHCRLNDFEKSSSVLLTYNGLRYFEHKKTERRNMLKRSIIIPVIATLLTQLLLFLLEQLLQLIL